MAIDNGNGHESAAPVEAPWREPVQVFVPVTRPLRPMRPILAGTLLLCTVATTLACGAQFQLAYRAGTTPFAGDESPFTALFAAYRHPHLLFYGIPFSLTLLGILLAHELGHYFTCRHYRIDATYPYFIPAPTLIGTMGAFIRIRSPIVNRRALFDVGISGPIVGFLLALPALAVGIALSKVLPGASAAAPIQFGHPLLERIFIALLRPGVRPQDLLLHPVARAAWVGLFATALNLIPAGQLDGGHILYTLATGRHRRISLFVALGLIVLGLVGILGAAGVRLPHGLENQWPGWTVWGILLLAIGFRHPPLVDRAAPLDASRRSWALLALVIFLLCFTPSPFSLS